MEAGSAFKPFYIVGEPLDGLIIDNCGNVYWPFKRYVQYMTEVCYAKNTIISYAQHLYRFLNYVHRAIELEQKPIGKPRLREIIKLYSTYLLHGSDASDPIICQIAIEQNKSNKTSLNSLAPIDHAISLFIRLGELEQFEKDENNKVLPLFSAARTLISTHQKKRIKKYSVIAGVIRGGLTAKERIKYGNIISRKKNNKNKVYTTRTIDLACINILIESSTNLRDKVFYSFLAASGSRTHEALQLRLEDIDVENKEVYLRDPFSLNRNKTGLTAEEEANLTWKGRNTETTFLIEPFKSLFFKYLLQYLKQDRISTCGHSFLFQNYKTLRPFFCSDRSSRIKQFKSAAKKSGIIDTTGIRPHSLRHSYGTYTLNYLPLPNGEFGLPIQYVKILMGHTSLHSTEVYAKEDEDLLKAQIQYANELLFGADEISLKAISFKYQESKLKEMKKEIDQLIQGQER